MERYDVMEVCGEGQFGAVYRAKEKSSRITVAIKKFKEKETEVTLREIALLKKVNHPNIVNLRDLFRVNGMLHLVFEFVPMSIFDLLGVPKFRSGSFAPTFAPPPMMYTCYCPPFLLPAARHNHCLPLVWSAVE